MIFQGKVTTDQEVIRQWIESRGGWPARLKKVGETGIQKVIHIGFPGCEEQDRLERISWDEFFESFNRSRFAFLYKDEVGKGDSSRSYHFM